MLHFLNSLSSTAKCNFESYNSKKTQSVYTRMEQGGRKTTKRKHHQVGGEQMFSSKQEKHARLDDSGGGPSSSNALFPVEIPAEIWCHIFSFLASSRLLATVGSVNHEWYFHIPPPFLSSNPIRRGLVTSRLTSFKLNLNHITVSTSEEDRDRDDREGEVDLVSLRWTMIFLSNCARLHTLEIIFPRPIIQETGDYSDDR